MNEWDEIRFFDDRFPQLKQSNGYGVYGTTQDLLMRHANDEVVIGIGDNSVRSQKHQSLVDAGLHLATIVHSSAVLSEDIELGAGTVIMPQAVLNNGVAVGKSCIINSGSIIEHDCQIGDFVHVSPGAVLGGGVMVGNKSWLGLGSAIKPFVKIGRNVTVGVGAAVIRNVPDDHTVAGVPAKQI
ncbi:MAG: acetyltransferase [Aestuariibacter sp.]